MEGIVLHNFFLVAVHCSAVPFYTVKMCPTFVIMQVGSWSTVGTHCSAVCFYFTAVVECWFQSIHAMWGSLVPTNLSLM